LKSAYYQRKSGSSQSVKKGSKSSSRVWIFCSISLSKKKVSFVFAVLDRSAYYREYPWNFTNSTKKTKSL